jgi:transcriptional regulator with XRE-family HTH domain
VTREDTDAVSGLLQTFCARLKRLQQASGLTQVALAGYAGLGKSQMSAILNGDVKELPDWDVIYAAVHACLDHASKRGRKLPPDLSDEKDWRRRYSDLERDIQVVESPRRRPVQLATAGEFSADIKALLKILDEDACKKYLPTYLPPGATLTQMARTIRLLSLVRRAHEGEEEPELGPQVTGHGAMRGQVGALSAGGDSYGIDPPTALGTGSYHT